MRALVRKLRGLLGIGFTWGGLWTILGAGVGLAVGVLGSGTGEVSGPIARWAVGMGLYGFAAGLGFGGLLAVHGAGATVFRLPLGRAATWGALGAGAVPLLFGALGMFEVGTTGMEVVAAILVTATLGGTFAPVAITLARRAELRALEVTASSGPEYPDASDEGFEREKPPSVGRRSAGMSVGCDPDLRAEDRGS